jgi:phage terminase large subunit-like protein
VKKADAAHPVNAYALAVTAGEVVASRLVRLACARHLDDLAHGAARGLVWNPTRALEAIDFFREILVLPERTDAGDALDADSRTSDRVPFLLQPFQAFIVGSVFGWYTVGGYRRFRELYVETAKGSGKTPLGAGMMLYLLVGDGEYAAQVYIAAVTKDQARLAFVDAEAMVNASPPLADALTATVNNFSYDPTRSYLRAISSERRGLDGKRVHGALIDELHEHATPIVVNKMRAGVKGRRNALIVKITNSGYDRTSVCWFHHEYSRKVLDGTFANDAWFAFIAGLDPCDACAAKGKWFPTDDCPTCDSWKVEGPHWLKANPNLGVSLSWQYLRERVDQAKGMPSEVSDVLRFNFCVWTSASARAIDMGKWAACLPMPTEAELVGAPCFGCLDLGETDDFSAFGRVWVLADGRIAVKMRYWLPDVALERFPNRPYDAWRRAGILTVTEGDVTDYEIVRATILDDAKRDGLTSVFYDQRTARETAQILMAGGLDMVPMAQGFALSEALNRLLELIAAGLICHGDDEILTWMASNVVTLTNSKRERRLAKERSPEKIDGIAALVNGIEGALIRRERKPPPSYQLAFVGGTPRG